jgi:integrase
MRVYKPTYSKPLPEGAKILRRKDGKFVRFKDGRGRQKEARLTKTGRILLEGSHWHIGFEDNLGISRDVKAYTDKSASQRAADRIQDLLNCQANNQPLSSELEKWLEEIPVRIRDRLTGMGLLDIQRSAAGKPLTKLVDEFKASLQAKERTEKYVAETAAMLKRVFDDCGFRHWTDILPTKIESYLKGLRDNGLSYRRSNGYLTAVKVFCNWMVSSRFAIASPVKHLKPLNVELDRRHERRAGTPDELRRLLEATANEPKRYGLTGYERALLYQLAAETGLRANELRTLAVSAFDFEAMTLTVETAYSKNRRQHTLPLRRELVAGLKDYCGGKMSAAKLFAYVTDHTSDMLKLDLQAAGIPYENDNGLVFDFHALRHFFVTNLSHAPSRVAQALARHRSSAMTDRYTHVRLHDERAAVHNMPDLTLPSSQGQKAAKTGTYDLDESLPKACFSDGQIRTGVDSNGQPPRLAVSKPHSKRARGDSNTQRADCQSDAGDQHLSTSGHTRQLEWFGRSAFL